MRAPGRGAKFGAWIASVPGSVIPCDTWSSSADEHALFTLTSAIWEVDAIVDVCRRARIHLSGRFTDSESTFSMNRRIPGVKTWRSWLVEAVVVVAIVVLVTISTLRYGPSSGG